MRHAESAHRRTRPIARWAAMLVGVLTIGAALTAPAPAAFAAAGVTVTSDLGGATADAEYSTTVHIEGSGFQSIQGGMGGIYVLFGWVADGAWQPSAGGIVGTDFLYVPDSESKDNQGFQRFVSFPGSETEAAAQAVMTADGAWAVDMTIPGPTFQAQDRDGNATSVDCRSVQCGIITFGAHGVKNANNETFSPISFITPETGTASAAAPEAAAAAPATGAIGKLSLGVDATKAAAGNALPFTARGFAVGEQVVASLDGGVVAVGPLTAGNAGEVAAVLPLPADLAAGTHLLTVRGAATEGSVEAEITVTGNPLAAASGANQSETPAWLLIVMVIAIALASTLLVVNVVVALVRASRRRRAKRAEAALAAGPDSPDAVTDDRMLPPYTTPAASAPDDETMPIPTGVSA